MVSISEKRKIIRQLLNTTISPTVASKELEISLMEVWALVDKYGTDRSLTQSEWKEIQELEEKSFAIVRKNIAVANKPEIVTSVITISSNNWTNHDDCDIKKKSKHDSCELIIAAGTA